MKLLGGFEIIGANPAQEKVFSGRDAFIRKYATERGWDVENLSFSQVLEIRKEEGWKTPNNGQLRS